MTLAIITGGSRGLGFETARALKAQGHQIVLVAQDAERLKSAAQQLECDYRAADLENINAAEEMFRDILLTFGTPQILVLAHGVMSEKMSKTLKTTTKEWRRVMAINLDSVFTAVNILGPSMADARDGRIIIFSACLGRMSGPGNAG